MTEHPPRELPVGARAPDFTLPGPDGAPVALSDLLRDTRALVIFFYPKDETPGCTAQACAFRDAYQDLRAAGARLVGVSSDPPGSHERFAEHHGLPFPLLSDVRGDVRRAFGVRKTLGLIPGRVTFVLDGDGVVRGVFRSQLRAAAHADQALAIVQALP